MSKDLPGNSLVGIVIPTFRESESIQSLLQELLKYIPTASIVVVDDSPDMATADAVEAFAAQPGHSSVKLVHRNEKGGRGSAVLEGIRALLSQQAPRCEQIVEMDADFSHPPGQIPSLLEEATGRELDLLIASRYLAQSEIRNWPLSRRVFSGASNRLAHAVLRVPVADYTNGFRIYSRKAAEDIVESCGHLGKGFIALSEILVNLYYRGFQVGETPTIFTNRMRGESSLSYAEIKNAAGGLYRIYLLSRRLKGAKAVRATGAPRVIARERDV